MPDGIMPSGFDPATGYRIFGGRYESEEAELRLQQIEKEAEPEGNFLNVLGGSLRYSALGTLAEETFKPEHEVDLSFDLDEALKIPEVEAISPKALADLRLSRSQEEFDQTLAEIKEEEKHTALVKSYGAVGIGAEMITGMIADAPLDVLMGGVNILSKGTRLQRAIRGAGIGAGLAVSTEAISAAHMHTRDEHDVMYSALLGAGIGAGLGTAFGGRFDQLADQEVKRLSGEVTERMDKELVGIDTTEDLVRHTNEAIERLDEHRKMIDSFDAEDAKLTAKTREGLTYKDVTDAYRISLGEKAGKKLKKHDRRKINEVWESLKKDELPIGNRFLNASEGAAGAATVADPRGVFKTKTEKFGEELATAREAIGIERLGISDAARVSRSKNEFMRGIGQKLLNPAAGPLKGENIDVVAAIRKERYQNHLDDALHKDFRKAEGDFLKHEGANFTDFKGAVAADRKLNAAIIQEMNERYFTGKSAKHKHLSDGGRKAVIEACDALDNSNFRAVDLQNLTGAAENLQRHSGWFSRNWNASAWSVLAHGAGNIQGIGREGVIQLVELSLSEGARRSDMLSQPELFKAIASAMTDRFIKKDAKLDDFDLKKLSLDSKEDLIELLEGHGASPDIIDLVDDFMTTTVETKTGPKHLRRRATMDMSVSITDKFGNEHRIADLLSQNMHKNAAQYNRVVAGHSALNAAGFKDAATAKRAVQKAKQHMIDNWQDGFDSSIAATKQANKEAAILNANIDLLMGKVPGSETNAGLRRALEVVQDFTNITSLGLMSIVQTAEIGRILAAHGVMNVIKTLPELRGMFRRFHDGTIDNIWIKEMEYATGFKAGDDVARNPYILREELGNSYAVGEFPNVYDKTMAAAKNWVGKLSGQEYIMSLQNKIQFRVMAGKFYDLAKNPTKANMAQMRELGLGDDWLDKVLSNINKYSTPDEPLGLSKWDFQTREKFADAIMIANSTQIQKQLVGDLQSWMYSPLGNMLTQFRKFSLAAVDKQSIRFFRSENRGEQYMTFLYTAALGSTLYGFKQYLNTLGMSNRSRRKYLKQRLSPMAILGGTLQMVGQTSMAPEAWDKVNMLFGGGLGFGAGRGKASTGGQGTADALMGVVPGVRTIGRGVNAIKAVAKPIVGEKVSKQENKDLLKFAIPIDSLITGSFINWLIE